MIRAGRRTLACALLLCALAGNHAWAGVRDTKPIQVRIENAAGERIRCVAVLAHFVTRTLPPIPGGQAQEITLVRDHETGTLSYGSHGGHPMMLENLLCGTVADWTASARDVPVQDLRSGKAERFDYRCTLASESLSCALR